MFLSHLDHVTGVIDGGANLQSMAYNPSIVSQALNISLGERGYQIGIKTAEHLVKG